MKKLFFSSFFLVIFFSNNSAFAFGCNDKNGYASPIVCEPQELLGGGYYGLDPKYEKRRSKCLKRDLAGRRTACSTYEIDMAANQAGDAVMNAVKIKGEEAVRVQTAICSHAYQRLQDDECNLSKLSEPYALIEEIKKVIEVRTEQIANISYEAGKPELRSNDSVLSSMLTKATELKKEIEAANEFLSEQKEIVRVFASECLEQKQIVDKVCVDPQYRTQGDQIIIEHQTATATTTTGTVPAEASSSEGDVEATVYVNASGPLFTPLIVEDNKNGAQTRYRETIETRREIETALSQTSSTITQSNALADNVIATLSQVVNPSGEREQDEGCNAIQRARNECGAPPVSDATESFLTGRDGPYSMGTPAGGTGSGSTATRGKTTPGGNTGGVTADQASQDAGNMAYGAPGSSGGDTGSNTGGNAGAGTGSAAGGLGNVMGGLGALGSVFGKTGGGYGADSSYGSTRSNLRGGSNSGSNSGGFTTKSNSGNSGYNYKSGANNKGQSNDGSNSPNQNSFNPGQGYGNYGAGMPGMGGGNAGSNMGSSSSGNSNNEKPGFINRLLGRQKDKTLFGKRSGGGSGGGSFGNTSRSGFGNNSPMGSSISDKAGTNDNARVFDATKYAPSKAAQDRAYARATGRKIASHTNEVSSAAFEWPKDISTDKNGNLFRKAGLSVRVNLSK